MKKDLLIGALLIIISVLIMIENEKPGSTVVIQLEIPKLEVTQFKEQEAIDLINPDHLRKYIIVPTLEVLARFDERINTPEAVELLIGTIAQESSMGYSFHQIGGGPGKGIYSIEPSTHKSIWHHYINRKGKEALRDVVLDFLPAYAIMESVPNDEELYNPVYATVIARISYWYRPEALPEVSDITGQAEYWKKYFNTEKGKGTVEQYVASYKEFVR